MFDTWVGLDRRAAGGVGRVYTDVYKLLNLKAGSVESPVSFDLVPCGNKSRYAAYL